MNSESKYNRYFYFGDGVIKCKNCDYIINISKLKTWNTTTQLRYHLENKHQPMFDTLNQLYEETEMKKLSATQSFTDHPMKSEHSSFIINDNEEQGCSTGK